MPSWVVLVTLAIVCWLALAVGGGLLVGRLLDVISRRLLLQRRRLR
jgi:hypothetical protein